jgi:hypothetical protein
MSGKGGWNPSAFSAQGGGTYIIRDKTGAIKMQGSWKVLNITSFEQFPGWWPHGFKEEG